MAERDPRQECGCPPWVECVHFDGQVVYLCDIGIPTERLHGHTVTVPRYAVALGRVVDCYCGRGENIFITDAEGPGRYDSLPAAQAEFARRAELLRLGEAARA